MAVERAQSTHIAASEMVRMLALDKRACNRIGWSNEAIRKRVTPLVHELERAQPQLAQGGPCLEYPWLSPTRGVLWPNEHLPLAQRFRAKSTDAMLVMNFATDLHRRFDQVFG